MSRINTGWKKLTIHPAIENLDPGVTRKGKCHQDSCFDNSSCQPSQKHGAWSLSRFSAWLKQGHFILWLVSLFIVFSLVYETFSSEEKADFRIYRAAGAVVGSSSSIYDIALPCRRCGPDGPSNGYLYPPLLAVAFKVYEALSPFSIELLWPMANAVAIYVVTSCFYLLGLYKVEKVPLVAIYMVLWLPTMDGLALGQIHLFVLALLAVFLVACERGAAKVAGTSLALAIHLKITPVLLLPVLLTKKGRPALVPFVLAMLLLTIFSALFDGPRIFMRFLELSSTLGYGDQYWSNPTNMTPARIFSGSLLGLNAANAINLQRALVVLALVFSVIQVLRSRNLDTTRLGAQLIIVMVLASPIVWYHHTVWLLVPFGVALKENGFRRKAVVATSLLCLTSSVYIQIYTNIRSAHPYESVAGAVILIVVGVVLLTLLRAVSSKDRVKGAIQTECKEPHIA